MRGVCWCKSLLALMCALCAIVRCEAIKYEWEMIDVGGESELEWEWGWGEGALLHTSSRSMGPSFYKSTIIFLQR